MAKRKANVVRYDHVWGIERHKQSDNYGQLVLGGDGQMPIILWKRPGSPIDKAFVTGGLRHNDRVKVLSRTVFRGVKWAEVETTVTHEGREYLQKGWLSETLLKRLGD